MPYISDASQKKKLKKTKINIKTKYIVGNQILERNTNNSNNDDIKKGIRCEKDYYVNEYLAHKETKFDSRIEYTFISKEQEEEEYTCVNCGMHSKLRNFIDGCPYCKTNYNIDYSDKDLGGKYHYDRVLRTTTYRLITAFVDVVISLLLSFLFIKMTSRTFNSFDIAKIFIYGGILSLVLYYLFYIIDGYIVLGPIKKYKDKQNQKQKEFWERTKIDKKTFFNNLNYEVEKKYYQIPEVIDYDIIDYDEFKDSIEEDILCVTVKAYVRIISYEQGKITAKYKKDIYHLKNAHKDILEMSEGANIIKCPNCGSSIDAAEEKCEYCNTPTHHLQEWVLIEK